MLQYMHYCWQPQRDISATSHNYFQHMHQHPLLPLLIRQELYEAGADTGPHRHEDFYALYVVQSGKGIHVINDHPYGIARGDVYMLPPASTHAYRDYHSLTVEAFYFQPQLFADDELLALRSLAGLWSLLIDTNISSPNFTGFSDHRLHLPPERYHTLDTTITEIRTEFLSTSREAAILTRNLFFRMLVHLSRWQSTQRSMLVNDNEAAVKQIIPSKVSIARVLQLCEERFSEPLTVPQLASFMFLSPSRFTELFVQEVGTSPATYIRHLRLERAQTLLRTTMLSTTVIAHQVGFRDSAQLSRAFHTAFHLTPTAYRATFK